MPFIPKLLLLFARPITIVRKSKHSICGKQSARTDASKKLMNATFGRSNVATANATDNTHKRMNAINVSFLRVCISRPKLSDPVRESRTVDLLLCVRTGGNDGNRDAPAGMSRY